MSTSAFSSAKPSVFSGFPPARGKWGDGGGSGGNRAESDGMLWRHPLPWSQMIWLESCAQGCFARDEEYCGFFGGMERRCR